MRFIRSVGFPLLVAVFVLFAPILMPIGFGLLLLHLRRLAAQAKAMKCARCGEVLGVGALRASDSAWRGTVREAQEKHPGARLRMVRPHHAICANCGLRYRYAESERKLVPSTFSPMIGMIEHSAPGAKCSVMRGASPGKAEPRGTELRGDRSAGKSGDDHPPRSYLAGVRRSC
jgi:hypothetical protein